MSNHRGQTKAASRRLQATALLAAFAAGWGLLACSSGEPTNPAAPDGRDDTYVFARLTLLDRGAVGGTEFFNCTTLDPVAAGRVWSLRGDIATSGVSLDTGTGLNVAVTASDLSENTGVAIEFRIPDRSMPDQGVLLRGLPGPGDPCTNPSADVNGVFADIDLLCARLDDNTVQESRFTFDPCEPWSIEITSYETGTDGNLQLARSVGGNEFDPSGILEGRFSFVGKNLQSTPGTDITAMVQVDGCFRVSVPPDERGVPSNPNAPGALCSP